MNKVCTLTQFLDFAKMEAILKYRWNEKEFVAHSSSVTCLMLGRKSGKVMATGGEDKKVNLWAIGKPHCVMSLTGHSTPVECVMFGKQEEFVCAGAVSGAIKVWDLEAAKIIRTLTGHKSNVKGIDMHPHGDFIASGSSDNTIKLWDIRRKGCIFTYKGHDGPVHKVKFSPDGRWIASGGEENVIRLWDLAAGKMIFELSGHDSSITDLEFHPNEFLLASSSSDGTVKFWDLENYHMVSSTDVESGPIKCVLFNPDGNCLFSGSEDLLKVYGWEPASTFDTLVMGWGAVYDLTVSDNQLIAAAFCATNVSVYVVDLRRVNLLPPSPVENDLNSETAQSSPRRNEREEYEKFFQPNETYVISCPVSPLRGRLHSSSTVLPPLGASGNRPRHPDHKRMSSGRSAAILVHPLNLTFTKPVDMVRVSCTRSSNEKLSSITTLSGNADVIPTVSVISRSDVDEEEVLLFPQLHKNDANYMELLSEHRDKPAAIRLEDFLPRYLKESVRFGLQSHPEISDAEVMSSIFRGHESMTAVLGHRRKNLMLIIALWHRKGVKIAMEAAVNLKDDSVLVDVLSVVSLKPSVWTLDMCQILLPGIIDLLHSKYEMYINIGCQSLKLIIKNFAPLIKSNILAPKGVGVDISREERYKKCVNCMKQLYSVQSSLVKRQSLQGKVGHSFRELNLMLQSLE